jgi:hypothetical protein
MAGPCEAAVDSTGRGLDNWTRRTLPVFLPVGMRSYELSVTTG